jgi:hypothetical protein
MRYLVTSTLFLTLSNSVFSQYRWGNELSSQFEGLSYTTHVQRVVRNHFLIGVGLGNISKQSGSDYNDFDSISSFKSTPNEVLFNGEKAYHSGENTKIKGAQFQLMTGYFLETKNKKHGLRMNVNFKFGWMFSTNVVFYKTNDTVPAVSNYRYINFFQPAVSLDLYHTIRITEKNTFYYGFKNAVYIPSNRYKPTERSEAFRYYVPEIGVGLTHYFDLKKKD